MCIRDSPYIYIYFSPFSPISCRCMHLSVVLHETSPTSSVHPHLRRLHILDSPSSLHHRHAVVVAPSIFRSSDTSSFLRYPFQISSGHSLLLHPINMPV